MTPGARAAAAMAVLDRIRAGDAAEAALIAWARSSRFAGSGDRAAVRDLVFDILRRRRSAACAGGGDTGRALVIGALRLSGIDPATLLTGQGHAPPPLEPGEGAARPCAGAAAMDLPDWLWDRFQADLGPRAADVALALRDRAPVYLRANLARTDPDAAARALSAEGIEVAQVPGVRSALRVTAGERRIAASAAYRDGLVELQDAASQAAVLRLDLRDGMRVLDYCAGGGGKALAMAALARLEVTAHDASPGRMRDLPARAARAGTPIALAAGAGLAPGAFDLVLVDAPCSGSGTWRRSPDAKWRLDPAALDRLVTLQARILGQAAPLVRPGGRLAYATCSVLRAENEDQMAGFLAAHPDWRLTDSCRWDPGPAGDGFFLAQFERLSATPG